VKQVPTLAVLNFDFVIPFVVPFRFQNVTRRVTGFDCFQYTSRQLANRNVCVRPTRGYGYNESGQQSQATRYVHQQQCYLGPNTPDKQMAHAITTTRLVWERRIDVPPIRHRTWDQCADDDQFDGPRCRSLSRWDLGATVSVAAVVVACISTAPAACRRLKLYLGPRGGPNMINLASQHRFDMAVTSSSCDRRPSVSSRDTCRHRVDQRQFGNSRA
jgi:hypothetical protein